MGAAPPPSWINPFDRTQEQIRRDQQQHQHVSPSEEEEAEHERIKQLLKKKLGPEYLSQRQGGGGTKLTYIEGWRVINLANEIFGFNGWYTEIKTLEIDFIDQNPETGRFNIGCTAIVRVWLKHGGSHEDVGYGKLENSKSKADALDKCKKEAVTDALKRTLRNFGSVLGNCLYDKHYTAEVSKMKAPKEKFSCDELLRADYAPPSRQTTKDTGSATGDSKPKAAPPPAPVVDQKLAPPPVAVPPARAAQPRLPPSVSSNNNRPITTTPSLPPTAKHHQQSAAVAGASIQRPDTADLFGGEDDSVFAEMNLDLKPGASGGGGDVGGIEEGDSGYASGGSTGGGRPNPRSQARNHGNGNHHPQQQKQQQQPQLERKKTPLQIAAQEQRERFLQQQHEAKVREALSSGGSGMAAASISRGAGAGAGGGPTAEALERLSRKASPKMGLRPAVPPPNMRRSLTTGGIGGAPGAIVQAGTLPILGNVGRSNAGSLGNSGLKRGNEDPPPRAPLGELAVGPEGFKRPRV